MVTLVTWLLLSFPAGYSWLREVTKMNFRQICTNFNCQDVIIQEQEAETKEKKEVSQQEIMSFIHEKIQPVQMFVYRDPNKLIDLVITFLQNEYNLSWPDAENYVTKYFSAKKYPIPGRSKNMNYIIIRRLHSRATV